MFSQDPLLRRARTDQRGASLLEYLALVGLIALVAFAGVRLFGQRAKAKSDAQAACVSSLECGGTGAAGSSSDVAVPSRTQKIAEAAQASTGAQPAEVATPTGSGAPEALPPPPPAARKDKSLLEGALDVGKGFVVDGVWGTVTGLWQVVTHPVDTAQGLWTVVTHPVQTGTAIKDAVVKAWDENPERLIGAGIFEVVTLPIGALKATKVGTAAKIADKVADAGKIADKVLDAAKLADKATDVAKIADKGADIAKVADDASDAARAAKVAMAAKGMCFVAGTPVLTVDGLRPIESIREGDLVVSRDEETGRTSVRSVVRTFVHDAREVITLELTMAGGRVERIGVTPDHRIWSRDRGWMTAGALVRGEPMLSSTGAEIRVARVSPSAERATVYNFEVDELHTYFVGESGTWVHNDCAAATKAARLKFLVDEVKAGRFGGMTSAQLREVQAHALDTVQKTFKNQFGDDGRLLEAVADKKRWYEDALKTVDDSALAGRPVAVQQLDALQVLLKTFQGTDAGDVALRGAVLDKLGKMGRASDIDAILPLVRRAPTPTDLYNGLESIKGILAREGSPQLRGARHLGDDVTKLLAKSALTDAERTRVIESVLQHGEVASVKRHVGGNMNEVYFVTFKETLPGAGGERIPIRAVFKPENTYVGKDKAYFGREVSAYEFDRDFAKTGRVPPTVEGIFARAQSPGDVKPFGAGSLQYMIPNAEALGTDAIHLNPKFKPFLESAEGKRQMGEIKTLLYTLNDPDKLPNPGGFKTPNYGNIMAQADPANPGRYKLFMIDNGGGQGALGKQLTTDILPAERSHVADTLAGADPAEIERKLAPLVGDDAAADVAARTTRVRKPRRRRAGPPRRRRPRLARATDARPRRSPLSGAPRDAA